jgi:hypothetical protein
MSYDLAAFITDTRAALKANPGPAGREKVRQALERLLQDEDFLTTHCSEATPPGLYRLHDDAELGFQILAHFNKGARVSPPHDHGRSWAIYGQATLYTDMNEWERTDNSADADKAALRLKRSYRLMPGQAGIFQDGDIHSIDYPENARFIRVTGANLDEIDRVKFDLKTGAVTRMTRQQAT